MTHDQIEAMTMADRIVVMRDGYVEQIGSPLELYDWPANTFVAAFLGSPSMNMLEGRIDGSDFMTAGGRAVRLPPAMARPVDGRPLILSIQPEDLSMSDETDVSMKVELVVVEPTGAETMLATRLGGIPSVASSAKREVSAIGATVTLHFDSEKARFMRCRIRLAHRMKSFEVRIGEGSRRRSGWEGQPCE